METYRENFDTESTLPPTWAIVLIGGFGTRLRPLTQSTPKQMLLVGPETTMLEQVLGYLKRSGVEQVVLSLGFQPDAFIQRYPDQTYDGLTLHFAVEPAPLDTAGAIRFAAHDANVTGAFYVLNGDILTDIDLGEMWAQHCESGSKATIALTPVDDPSRYGVVVTDDAGWVSEFVEKPSRESAPSHWINAGIYLFDESVLELIPPDRPVSVERETFPLLVDLKALSAVRSEQYWIDAGTFETYTQANRDLIDGVRDHHTPAVATDVAIHPNATVHNSVIAPGVSIGDGARVSGSVVMNGAIIGGGAVVENSVIADAATVGEFASIIDLSVVGSKETIPPHEVLVGVVRPTAGS